MTIEMMMMNKERTKKMTIGFWMEISATKRHATEPGKRTAIAFFVALA